MNTPMKVLIAGDGSDPALRACEFLVPLLPRNTEVRIVTVLSLDLYPWSLVAGRPLADEAERKIVAGDAVEDATREAFLRFEKAGISVDVTHRYGNAVDEILAESDEWEPDLLVMGRRCVRGVERMIGSVSEHVLRRTCVPTVLVP